MGALTVRPSNYIHQKLKIKDDNEDGKVEYSSVLINCFDFLNEKNLFDVPW